MNRGAKEQGLGCRALCDDCSWTTKNQMQPSAWWTCWGILPSSLFPKDPSRGVNMYPGDWRPDPTGPQHCIHSPWCPQVWSRSGWFGVTSLVCGQLPCHCIHTAFPLCTHGESYLWCLLMLTQVPAKQGATLMISFSFRSFLTSLSPNTITLGVRTSANGFGGGTPFGHTRWWQSGKHHLLLWGSDLIITIVMKTISGSIMKNTFRTPFKVPAFSRLS